MAYGEKLDLGPYMAIIPLDTGPLRYSLYGVVVHLDHMNSTTFGHYVSYVCKGGDRWFDCDDTQVTTMLIITTVYILPVEGLFVFSPGTLWATPMKSTTFGQYMSRVCTRGGHWFDCDGPQLCHCLQPLCVACGRAAIAGLTTTMLRGAPCS